MDVYLNIGINGTVVLTIGQPMYPEDQWLVCPFEDADFPEEIARGVEREAEKGKTAGMSPVLLPPRRSMSSLKKCWNLKKT